jgi:photosystem II stability/assembly factor-like uncharacterized protein
MRMSQFALILAAVVLTLGLAPRHAGAGAPWQKIYDVPSASFSAIEMFDDSLGLASTSAAIFRTTDGGATWTQPSDEVRGASAFAFADASRVWRISGSQIDRSDDGGLTWTPQATGSDVILTSIAVVSRDDVWLAGDDTFAGAGDVGPLGYRDSVVLHTTDGGATWQRVSPLAGYATFDTVAFAGADGWLVASPCKSGQSFQDCPTTNRALLRTTDAGRTWQVASASPNYVPTTIAFPDATHGYGTGGDCNAFGSCGGALHKSIDGGRTWTPLANAPHAFHLRFTSANDGWYNAINCGEPCTGALAHTTDGGATWTDVPADAPGYSPFDATPNRVVVTSPKSGLAVYNIASRTFTPAITPTAPSFWDVAFATDSATSGAASGYKIYRVTADGGRTWQELPQPAQLSELHPASGGVIWATAQDICEHCPNIYRSLDAGRTWTAAANGNWTFISALEPSPQPGDGDRAWVVADNGLWRTSDGGASWQFIEAGNSAYMYSAIDHNHGYTRICPPYQCQDSFRFTSDGGDTWETRPLPLSDGLIFVTPDVGFAEKYEPHNASCPCSFPLIGTTDGGRTWDEIARLDTTLRQFIFTDARHGWALGQSSTAPYASNVMVTSDGGHTWDIELTLPAGPYGVDLQLHGGVLTLRAGAGSFGLDDRTFLYERAVATATRPPVIPPDAGTGPDAGSPPWRALALAAALLGASLIVLGRRPRRTGQ